MAKSAERRGQNPIYGAAIPLAKSVKLDRERLLGELRDVVGLAGARVRMLDEATERRGILASIASGPQELTFEIAGVRVSVRSDPRPLCGASAMHAFINPTIWRSGASGMTRHRAHLLIAEATARGSGSADAMFDRATAVTLATAAVASLVQAEGVVWLPARNALPMSVFGSEMERFIDGQAPLQFWMRTQILPAPVQQELELGALAGEALHPGVATMGLAAFVGCEIIAPPSHCDRDTMLEHIYALASAVIDENADLEDGAVFGTPGAPTVCLRRRQSGRYSDLPYWELLPRPVAAAKGAPSAEDGSAEAGEAGHVPHLRLVTPGT
jgi:hypothetical protein